MVPSNSRSKSSSELKIIRENFDGNIHELTDASLVQLVDDTVSVVHCSCGQAVLTVCDLNVVGSARSFFTVTSTAHHSSSGLVVNLCMERASWFCCLGDNLCACCAKVPEQPSLFHSRTESFSRSGTTPIVEGTCLQCRRKRALLDLETHGRRAGWHEFHWNPIVRILDAKTVCRVTEAGIDFVNGLDANVVVDCHDRTFVALSNDTVIVVFDNLIFQTCGNCRGRSSSLRSRPRRSALKCANLVKEVLLLVPPNSCGTLIVLAPR